MISRTAESALSLGKILIGWGILFLLKLGLAFLIAANEDYFNKLYSRIPYIFHSIYPAFIILAILIYILYSRKLSIIALGKQLMKIWVFIIGFNILSPMLNLAFNRVLGINPYGLSDFRPAVSLITFAIGFYITYIFTDFKLTRWLCIIYTIAGFLAFIPGTVPNTFTDYIWPFTFLILGGYFEYKNKKARRMQFGY